MNIIGKKVMLRAIEEKDLHSLHEWANDPEIWYLLGGWHFPSSIEDVKKWFGDNHGNQLNQRFAIETENEGLIGTANLVDIDWKNNHSFHGMMIGKKDIRGKGYGVDTIMTIMKYSFEELHFKRLDGSMIEYNTTSLHVYCNKCGWKEEGRLREWYFRKNKYWDKIIVGITKEDYVSLISTNNYWG